MVEIEVTYEPLSLAKLISFFTFCVAPNYRTKQGKPSLELQGPERQSTITRDWSLLDRPRWWFSW